LGLIKLFQAFTVFVTKQKVPAPMIYQNYNAVVAMAMKGGGKLCVKHLQARMNLGKEIVDDKQIQVIHKNAGKM
jgi:hypothetical protein